MKGDARWARLGVPAAVLLLLALAPAVRADAVFAEVRVIEGMKVYPDSADPSLFYFAPLGLELKSAAGVPVFSFQRFRYVGRRATGDAGSFWGRGVISFTVRFVSPREKIELVSRLLSRQLQRQVRLEPLPVVDIESELVYTAVSENDEIRSGTLGAGQQSEEEEGELWDERSFFVGADPLSADMLWQTYHSGAVALSLNVSVYATGLTERDSEAGSGQAVRRNVMADAVRIAVSPDGHPNLFQSIDLEAQMPAGYTFLDVYCYDFQAAEPPEDLWAVVVEVRGRAATGDRPVETVRFDADRPERFKREVHFRFAMDLDSGYEFRVTRIYGSGQRRSSEWQHVADWTGIRDVSSVTTERSGSPLDARPLDPRFLY